MLLKRSFFSRSTVTVARELLGKIIIRNYRGFLLKGMIVETEAYQSDDPACHAYRGKTKRNCALFGDVGHAYVYFIYGNHYCLNVVARTTDLAAGGVLIRALEPIEGVEMMKKLRHKDTIANLTNGPGKLAQALAIDKRLIHVDLTKKGELYVLNNESIPNSMIKSSSRIGISDGTDKLWRFFIKDNKFVSKVPNQ